MRCGGAIIARSPDPAAAYNCACVAWCSINRSPQLVILGEVARFWPRRPRTPSRHSRRGNAARVGNFGSSFTSGSARHHPAQSPGPEVGGARRPELERLACSRWLDRPALWPARMNRAPGCECIVGEITSGVDAARRTRRARRPTQPALVESLSESDAPRRARRSTSRDPDGWTARSACTTCPS